MRRQKQNNNFFLNEGTEKKTKNWKKRKFFLNEMNDRWGRKKKCGFFLKKNERRGEVNFS
jgi:hypothetical protein